MCRHNTNNSTRKHLLIHIRIRAPRCPYIKNQTENKVRKCEDNQPMKHFARNDEPSRLVGASAESKTNDDAVCGEARRMSIYAIDVFVCAFRCNTQSALLARIHAPAPTTSRRMSESVFRPKRRRIITSAPATTTTTVIMVIRTYDVRNKKKS